MSDRILTSNITGAINFPFTKISLDFLQDAYLSEINALAKSKIDNYQINTVYRLDGFQVDLSASVYTWTAGTLFYNDEIFFIDAGTVAQGVGEVLILNIATTFLGTDPVAFRPSGSGSFNVHQTKSFVATSGTTGTGVSDADNVIGITKTMFLEIGTWDMQNVSDKLVLINLYISQIRSVDVLIIDDSLAGSYPINFTTNSQGWLPGGYFLLEQPTLGVPITRCDMSANPTGYFIGTSFNGAANRGFIKVTYEI
jgi:hypothetical protein